MKMKTCLNLPVKISDDRKKNSPFKYMFTGDILVATVIFIRDTNVSEQVLVSVSYLGNWKSER